MKFPNICLVLKMDNRKVVSIAHEEKLITDTPSSALLFRLKIIKDCMLIMWIVWNTKTQNNKNTTVLAIVFALGFTRKLIFSDFPHAATEKSFTCIKHYPTRHKIYVLYTFDEVNRFFQGDPINKSKSLYIRSRINAKLSMQDVWEQYIVTYMY